MEFTVNITGVWYVMVCRHRNLLIFMRNYCLYLLVGRIKHVILS